MKLDAEEILELVGELEDERAEYNHAADTWEAMWRLSSFTRTPKQAIMLDGEEQVTLPVPYNVVTLAMRMMADDPTILVPTSSVEKDDETAATKRKRFLTALWQRTNRQQRANVVVGMKWQAYTLGRFCLDIKWVRDEYPEKLKDRYLPILPRNLDPRNVGIKHGPLHTEYAFHKIEKERRWIRQMYPDVTFGAKGEDSEECTVIDFWWFDDKGEVWNAILVDEDFAVKPVKTLYPDIPIIEGYGDTAPVEDETYKGMSILHPIKDLWPYQNRLASKLGTSLLYYLDPIQILNKAGTGDVKVKPGGMIRLGKDDKFTLVSPSVNLPLMEAMMGLVDAQTSMSLGWGKNLEALRLATLLTCSRNRQRAEPTPYATTWKIR